MQQIYFDYKHRTLIGLQSTEDILWKYSVVEVDIHG